jgi:hypothetical protein
LKTNKKGLTSMQIHQPILSTILYTKGLRDKGAQEATLEKWKHELSKLHDEMVELKEVVKHLPGAIAILALHEVAYKENKYTLLRWRFVGDGSNSTQIVISYGMSQLTNKSMR